VAVMVVVVCAEAERPTTHTSALTSLSSLDKVKLLSVCGEGLERDICRSGLVSVGSLM
jgi:hypothetical protein